MRRGFALLMTLWLLVPLSVLFILLAGAARSDGQVAANLRDAAVLQAAADGGIETTILALVGDRSTPPAEVVAIGGARVAIDVHSLSGLVNPNLAPPELLRALLVRVGIAPGQADRLAAEIVEWRTPGQRGRAGEAKQEQYRAAGRDYGPPGAPFETIGELRDVLGMPPAAVEELKPYLSLFADRPPDPALAPPLVRAALGDLGTAARGGSQSGSVFRIAATATDRSRAAVVRSAVVRLAPGGNRPWRVLAWQTGPVPDGGR